MGLKPAEFYDLTWGDYQRACFGYRVRLDRGWDYTRHLMAASLGAMSTKKVNPRELIACSFDRMPELKRMTPEQWAYLQTAWNINTTKL